MRGQKWLCETQQKHRVESFKMRPQCVLRSYAKPKKTIATYLGHGGKHVRDNFFGHVGHIFDAFGCVWGMSLDTFRYGIWGTFGHGTFVDTSLIRVGYVGHVPDRPV